MKQTKTILQFTNLYLAFKECTEVEDKETLNMIQNFIYEYQPELCIFTGNQICADDQESSLGAYQLFLEFMNQFDIKVATTFGHRDVINDAMKSELRKIEAEHSKNHVEKMYSKIVNHKEAYVIEIKEQNQLLYQLYIVDNGMDGVIEPAHISWLKDVHKTTLDKYGYASKHNLLFSHKPVIETQNVMHGKVTDNDISNSDQLLSLIKVLGDFDGTFYGDVYDYDFSSNYQGIDLNGGRASGFSLYSNLAPGARLIELDSNSEYSTKIVDIEEIEEESLTEAQLIEEICKL